MADFYAELMGVLDAAGLPVEIDAKPSDVPGGIPFAEDIVHATYEPEWANRFWNVLVLVDRVLKEDRAPFAGKVSPVQLWWGSFDLAYSRFPGTQQAAAGFWPGDEKFPQAGFLRVHLAEAGRDRGRPGRAGRRVLEHGARRVRAPVRRGAGLGRSRRALLEFLESTYRAGAGAVAQQARPLRPSAAPPEEQEVALDDRGGDVAELAAVVLGVVAEPLEGLCRR